MNVNVCTRVRVLHLYLNYTICPRYSVNNNTCLLGDAILRIPLVSPTLIGHARYARVRAYRSRDRPTYDGVLSETSKRQPYIQSIEVSAPYSRTPVEYTKTCIRHNDTLGLCHQHNRHQKRQDGVCVTVASLNT